MKWKITQILKLRVWNRWVYNKSIRKVWTAQHAETLTNTQYVSGKLDNVLLHKIWWALGSSKCPYTEALPPLHLRRLWAFCFIVPVVWTPLALDYIFVWKWKGWSMTAQERKLPFVFTIWNVCFMWIMLSSVFGLYL